MENKCKYCGSIRKNKNSWRNHERLCPKNLNRVYINGMLGKKGSNQFIKAKKLGLPMPPGTSTGKPGNFTGRKHTKKTKEIMSRKRSQLNKGGKCSWYSVDGKKVQGSWEKKIAEILTENGIKWEKPTVGTSHSLKYLCSKRGYIRTYTPDFYIPELDLLIEVKGYWWAGDKLKVKEALFQNNASIILIEKEEFQKICNLGVNGLHDCLKHSRVQFDSERLHQ